MASAYELKKIWKSLIVIAGLGIGIFFLWYTNQLARALRVQEREKVALWAEATRQAGSLENPNADINFIMQVITLNKTVPVIVMDEKGNITQDRNLDPKKRKNEDYLKEMVAEMEASHEPMEIEYYGDQKLIIYYKDSTILTQLQYLPIFILLVVGMFILISYMAFSNSRKAQQNLVWAGMARETAHQIGTPLSSLMGWQEILKTYKVDDYVTEEIDKDIKRLQTITERFSKIGSMPELTKLDLITVTERASRYIKDRSSKKIKFSFDAPEQTEIILPLNVQLYEWVIENLLRNAIDAMDGSGHINIKITELNTKVQIDVSDSGKGIKSTMFKTIFQPGYTTKKRGWGLGLSLVKRIIEEYHKGQVFVLRSNAKEGTIFRISMYK